MGKSGAEKASSEGKRPTVAVPAEQGEFLHQAEDAEGPCVTGRPASRCECGLYDLAWAQLESAPAR